MNFVNCPFCHRKNYLRRLADNEPTRVRCGYTDDGKSQGAGCGFVFYVTVDVHKTAPAQREVA